MSPEELFTFDLNGYLVFRQALTPAELAMLNRALDACAPDEPQHFRFLHAHQVFMELLERPHTLAVLRELLGDWFRLDHAYGITMNKGSGGPETLHGGPREDQYAHHYEWRNGRMYNGLVVVTYALTDMRGGHGGFICVPGSHKANVSYVVPSDSPLVVQPDLQAGDMLLFTEALMHATRAWSAAHERRSLLYKYSPGYSTWAESSVLDPVRELATTDMQRALLRPPSVGRREPLPFGAQHTDVNA